MGAATASPRRVVGMTASWRALARRRCRFLEVQFALPAVGFRHCCHARRAAVFAASLAAGVAARTAAAARRAGTSIGSRKDQRMHHIAFWCCSVDSDAVLLRARHGGRHEGGGRRQRKRDEELVHLGCPLSSLNAECWRLLLTTQSNLETHRKRQ